MTETEDVIVIVTEEGTGIVTEIEETEIGTEIVDPVLVPEARMMVRRRRAWLVAVVRRDVLKSPVGIRLVKNPLLRLHLLQREKLLLLLPPLLMLHLHPLLMLLPHLLRKHPPHLPQVLPPPPKLPPPPRPPAHKYEHGHEHHNIMSMNIIMSMKLIILY